MKTPIRNRQRCYRPRARSVEVMTTRGLVCHGLERGVSQQAQVECSADAEQGIRWRRRRIAVVMGDTASCHEATRDHGAWLNRRSASSRRLPAEMSRM